MTVVSETRFKPNFDAFLNGFETVLNQTGNSIFLFDPQTRLKLVSKTGFKLSFEMDISRLGFFKPVSNSN